MSCSTHSDGERAGAPTAITPSLLADMQRLIDEPSQQCDGDQNSLQVWQAWLSQMQSQQRLPKTTAEAVESPDGPALGGQLLPSPLDLERFELLSVVGSGGFGIVFRARDRNLDREVALKILLPDVALSSVHCERFLREARAAAHLEHPGIVPVHGLGVDACGRPFFAMRYVQGESLGSAIQRLHATPRSRFSGEGWLDLRKLLSRFVSVCQTIEYAHSRGVVHRDLKPDNIMLGEFGETLVVDWGMAKTVAAEGAELASANGAASDEHRSDEMSPKTQAGAILGTPAYMSPEQAAGSADGIGPSSDIYSLGATLFAILTGQSPAPTKRPDAGPAPTVRPQPQSARAIDARIPKALDAICRKAMAAEAGDRYASPRALADDIERWLAGSSISVWRDPFPIRAVHWLAQHRAVSSALAAALLVAVASLLIASRVLSASRHQQHVAALVRRIETSELQSLPALFAELEPVRSEALPLLRQAAAQSASTSRSWLNVQLAFLTADEPPQPALIERLLQAPPDEFLVLRDILRPQGPRMVPMLWERWETHADPPATVLRVAAALAAYDPHAQHWDRHYSELAELIVADNPLTLHVWVEAFRPLSTRLMLPLRELFLRRDNPQEQAAVAELLSAYAENDSLLLVELLKTADSTQVGAIIRRLASMSQTAQPLLTAALNDLSLSETRQGRFDDPQAPIVARDRVRARAAIGLFAIGQQQRVWPLLSHSVDPTLRSQIIQLFAAANIDPQPLMDRWLQENNVSRRRALLLILGNYHPSALIPSHRQAFVEQVLAEFRSNPDPGLHSAADWLLRQWGEQEQVARAERDLAGDSSPAADRLWFVNRHGQTFVIVPGPVEFVMGSMGAELNHRTDERLHRRRIDRSFAISTREVTARELAELELPTHLTRFTSDQDRPAGSTRWFQAARYCRKLSELEGIPESQWCFPRVDQIGPGMQLFDDYLERTGYRLPTAAEWEYACRAGTISRTSFGNDIDLAHCYAWGVCDPSPISHPVALLQPSDLGLFDMLGNVSEWVTDGPRLYRSHPDWGPLLRDNLLDPLIARDGGRRNRGGSFVDPFSALRSAAYQDQVATSELPTLGFRLARTMPPEEVPFHVVPAGDSGPDMAVFVVAAPPGMLTILDRSEDVRVSIADAQQSSRIEVTTEALGATPFRFTLTRSDTGQQATVRGTLLRLNWDVRYYPFGSNTLNVTPTQAAYYLVAQPPLFVEPTSTIDFQWGLSAPHKDVPADHFAVVCRTTLRTPAGFYVMRCTADDGVFVDIDERPLMQEANERHPPKYRTPENQSFLKYLEEGEHAVRIVYYDWDGPAKLAVEFRPVDLVVP